MLCAGMGVGRDERYLFPYKFFSVGWGWGCSSKLPYPRRRKAPFRALLWPLCVNSALLFRMHCQGVFSLHFSAGERLAFFCNIPNCSASRTGMLSLLISMLPAECMAVLAVVLGDPPGVGIQFQQVSPSLSCDTEVLPWAVLSCEACPGVAGARPLSWVMDHLRYSRSLRAT